MRARIRWPPRRLRGQRGFTLIEMLVVMAILGILAMVVTMSMVGLTDLARTRANDAERDTIQSAMDAMIADQQIDPGTACAGSPVTGTDDMTQFPDGSAWTRSGGGTPVDLYPHYLRKQIMNRAYVCVGGGEVQPAHS